jgi:uncharacterized repeat protein (TIGR01451 family)
MLPKTPSRCSQIALALLCSVILSTGCASWQGPRIDPSGQRLFIWPGESPTAPPQTFAGPPIVGAPIVAPPPGATIVVPPPPPPPVPVQSLPSVTPSTPFGNMVAPPVYSDPTPAPIPAAPLVASVPPPVMQPAPVPIGPAQPMPLPPPPGYAPVMPVAAIVPAGCEHLQIMPTSLIAPVGSEMLLKANIPGRDGLLQANMRVDWSIACNSVGQFTEMGFRDRGQLLGFLEAPHKIDDWSATSSTAVVPITLNTGTPDPCDDIPIQRGEAWVTLSSPTEGTTVINAVAPWLDQFNQATATIHWIDAQWVFAQTAAVEAGRPHTLTTTVMRRTDGAPLPGWIVRYNVASGAALGYEGGNTIESTTDAAGRASVEVSPTNTSGGVTNVGITIIRPATGGAIPMPRLEVGRAATAITWGSAPSVPVTGAPTLPPAPALPGTPIPLPPPPSTFSPPPAAPQPAPAPTAPPATAPAPDPYAAPAATGKPRLEVTLGPPTPAQVAVGDNVSFNLTVTNRGDGVARHIIVSDRFDRGLRHPSAKPGEYTVNYDRMRDLAPNETENLPLTFSVADGGVQCHDVTVTADGAEPATQHGCVTASQPALEVKSTGPRRQFVGEVAKFNAVIKNIGDTTATNIEIVARYDAALAAHRAEQGHESLPDGRIRLKIDSLAPGEKRTFGLEALCKAPSNKACVHYLLSADGGLNVADEACFEILPQVPGVAPGAAGAQATNDLQLTIGTTSNPARVNQKMVVNVTVQNAGQQVERQVATRVLLPAELIPDPYSIKPEGEAKVLGQEIQFAPIAELAPGQSHQYVIPVTPSRTGKVQATAQVAATSLTTPKTVSSDAIDIIGSSP